MVYNEGIRMGAGGKPMAPKEPVELQEIIEAPIPIKKRKKVVVLEERVTDSLPTEVEVGE